MNFTKRIKRLYYLSLVAFLAVGILFVKTNRYNKTVNVVQTVKDKIIVVYSSNYKRMYINSKNSSINDMGMLCIEAVSLLKEGGLNPVYLKIGESDQDPFTASNIYLRKNLSKNNKYVLIDISRGQTRYGGKYQIQDKFCSSISMIISKKSQNYHDTLLFAGRIKEDIDKKYKNLPVYIITADDRDYNQSLGSMGMLVEFGDAANTYIEAKEALKVFCQSIIDVVSIEK